MLFHNYRCNLPLCAFGALLNSHFKPRCLYIQWKDWNGSQSGVRRGCFKSKPLLNVHKTRLPVHHTVGSFKAQRNCLSYPCPTHARDGIPATPPGSHMGNCSATTLFTHEGMCENISFSVKGPLPLVRDIA